jgi:hypothetical protein
VRVKAPVEVTGCHDMSFNLIDFPKSNNEAFRILDDAGLPIVGFKYKIVSSTGDVYRGITDNNGMTIRIDSGLDIEDLEIYEDF